MDILARLKLRLSDEEIVPSDEVLEDCIETAKNAILSRRYPYTDEWPEDVPARYQDLQLRIAMDLVNKIGVEGEITHIENGIRRDYTAGWVSSDLLAEITPYCGVIS